MKWLMDLLTEYNIAIIGLCTILMVVLTSVYVYLTGRILKSTNCPEILVYLRPSETYFHCLNLCVENVGTGLARDIKFTGNLSFAPDHDLPLEKIGFIKKGIDYLVYCPPKFGPLPKPRLWYNLHDLKGDPDGETKTKKLHP